MICPQAQHRHQPFKVQGISRLAGAVSKNACAGGGRRQWQVEPDLSTLIATNHENSATSSYAGISEFTVSTFSCCLSHFSHVALPEPVARGGDLGGRRSMLNLAGDGEAEGTLERLDRHGGVREHVQVLPAGALLASMFCVILRIQI